MDPIEQMYQENILDHYKKPHNFGEMEHADVRHHEHNPLCGDTIDMFMKIGQGKIAEVSFTGKGCAISQASASMLTDAIKGKTIREVEQMGKEEMLEMIGISLSPVRLKCAMLSLDTAKNSLLIYHKYMNKRGQHKTQER